MDFKRRADLLNSTMNRIAKDLTELKAEAEDNIDANDFMEQSALRYLSEFSEDELRGLLSHFMCSEVERFLNEMQVRKMTGNIGGIIGAIIKMEADKKESPKQGSEGNDREDD